MMALSPGLPELGGWQRTTVAMAKVSPLANSSADCFNSCSSIAVPCLGQSPIWPSVAAPQEMLQCQQAFQVVRRGEDIDMWKRGTHGPGQRLIVLHAQQRIQPDDLPAAAPDGAQLSRHQLRLTCVPSIAEDQDQCIAGKKLSRALIEVMQRLADLRAARPTRRF